MNKKLLRDEWLEYWANVEAASTCESRPKRYSHRYQDIADKNTIFLTGSELPTGQMPSLGILKEKNELPVGPSVSRSRSVLAMVAVALVLRLIVVGFLYPERLNPDHDHWRFAGETGRIARSIVEGNGFDSPLRGPTGPTAWMTPLYPAIVAAVFELFGIYTKASALTLLALNSLFSALTCIPVFFIARKSFGERTAHWAGWSWTFFPYAIYFSADFIWATTLTTLILSLLFLVALQLDDTARGVSERWVGFGVLTGISALTDPIVLSVAVPIGVWMCYRLRRNRQRWFVPAARVVLAFAIVVIPWFARNYSVFHTLVPFRDNIGLELYIGNNGNTWHFAPSGFHPSDTMSEWNEYQQLGELAYMKHKREQALAFIRAHPRDFILLCLRRVVYMWTNFWSFSPRYMEAEPLDPANIFLCTMLTVLALAGLRRVFQLDVGVAMPHAIVLFFFPLVYYVTHPEDYYRRPIDPMFVVLAAYAVVVWQDRRRARQEVCPHSSLSIHACDAISRHLAAEPSAELSGRGESPTRELTHPGHRL